MFAEKFPEKLGVILQYYDEIFLLLDSLIQSYYLRKHSKFQFYANFFLYFYWSKINYYIYYFQIRYLHKESVKHFLLFFNHTDISHPFSSVIITCALRLSIMAAYSFWFIILYTGQGSHLPMDAKKRSIWIKNGLTEQKLLKDRLIVM